ncbi:MAG: hypothetical protein M1820_000939 [Bogoriella megaspora]|nr:MAG: hypothetical protein M1820_000939 [Bogoriella megaspora]
MPKPRRHQTEAHAQTLSPPTSLPPSQTITRVLSSRGKNLYTVQLPSEHTLLVELAPQFRSTIWIKRNGYVVIDQDLASLGNRENKLGGVIVNIVGDERTWKKMGYWPKEFTETKGRLVAEEDDEDESRVGKMPPSGSEDEEDEEEKHMDQSNEEEDKDET